MKRRDWKAAKLVARDDSVFRRLIRDIKVMNSDVECDSKVKEIVLSFKFNRNLQQESCSALVKAYQDDSGEIEYNFVVAGEGLIFEGINFDLASRKLKILGRQDFH